MNCNECIAHPTIHWNTLEAAVKIVTAIQNSKKSFDLNTIFHNFRLFCSKRTYKICEIMTQNKEAKKGAWTAENTYCKYIYILVMSVNAEIHNAYNLHINKNAITIAPRWNFTKETNNFEYTEQRNNSSAEKTLKTPC